MNTKQTETQVKEESARIHAEATQKRKAETSPQDVFCFVRVRCGMGVQVHGFTRAQDAYAYALAASKIIGCSHVRLFGDELAAHLYSYRNEDLARLGSDRAVIFDSAKVDAR